MRFPLIICLLLTTFCQNTQAWGNDDNASEQLAYRWESLFSNQHTQPIITDRQPVAPLFQTSLTTTFAQGTHISPRLRDLLPDAAHPRANGLLATTNWLNGKFLTETEVAHSEGGANWLQTTMPGDNRMNASNRMVRLGFTGTQGSVRYGMTFRTAGKEVMNAPDETRREIWGEWNRNWVSIRHTVGQQWNNVSGDTTRSRLEQSYARVGVAFARVAWPELSFTYSHNSLQSAMEPLGIALERTRAHTLDGALAYKQPQWSVRLTSQYSLTKDLARGGGQGNIMTHVLRASFHPLKALTISPTLSIREQYQGWSGVRTENPSASLALHFKRSRRMTVSGLANYASTRSSDGLIDTETVGGKGILRLGIQRSSAWNALISFEAGYNRLSNRVSPAAGTEDISGLVRFVLAAL